MTGSSVPTAEELTAYYLRSVPAPVRALSARVPDAVLLAAFDAIDTARAAALEGAAPAAVDVAGFGTLPAADVRTVWCWLVDVVKSRHAVEWHAVNDAHYADVTARAAVLQGVDPAAVDWDAVPDDIFDGKPTALECAVEVLRAHAGPTVVEQLDAIALELDGVTL